MGVVAQDKAAEARRRLVAARALGLFARLGFDKVSFHDISKATGVPRTAIYRYFHTKREIFDAAIGGVLAELREAINGTLAERKPATVRLSRVCSLVIDGLFEHRDFLGAIFNFVFAMVTTGEDMSARVEGFTGGLKRAFRRLLSEGIADGIMYSCKKYGVPYVLAGSIRDDGPLPCVYGDVYRAQDAMRAYVKKATTVICMATMLHSIAVGNMTPSYRVLPDGTVRKVYFYCVDISEFMVNKLTDRGSLTSRGIVTNAQDFIVNIANGLGI